MLPPSPKGTTRSPFGSTLPYASSRARSDAARADSFAARSDRFFSFFSLLRAFLAAFFSRFLFFLWAYGRGRRGGAWGSSHTQATGLITGGSFGRSGVSATPSLITLGCFRGRLSSLLESDDDLLGDGESSRGRFCGTGDGES